LLVVRAHVGKNCLYVTLVGRVDEAHAGELVPLAVREMERLRPGFHIMSDVAYADVLSEPILEQVRRVMRAAQERGLGGVVRVVGRGVRVALQLERTSRQLGYAAHLAFSHEEAERLLLRARCPQQPVL
jgi:hypothetical protein